MARSVKAGGGIRKARSGAKRPASTVRLPVELVDRIDTWAGEHGSPTRVEAIRTLIEIGLATRARRVAAAAQRGRAATLANQQIDRMGDASATMEERANRKRSLTEGPSVFREVRRDRRASKAGE